MDLLGLTKRQIWRMHVQYNHNQSPDSGLVTTIPQYTQNNQGLKNVTVGFLNILIRCS